MPLDHTTTPLSRRNLLRLGSLALSATALSARTGSTAPRSVIFLAMSGGASHLDTFDPKPAAPAAIRGEFAAIPTSVPGTRIAEGLPKLARLAHRYTLLRSLTAEETHHERAAQALFPAAAPSTAARLLPADTDWSALPASHWMAQLPEESAAVRARYGASLLGQGALLARRLVEQGEPSVVVSQSWLDFDAHADLFARYRESALPAFDQALSALLIDLDERGLLDSTLVIATGEFGRTPRINAAGGRDHHAGAWSALLAGGGLAPGRVVGATDAIGAEVTDTPVRPADLLHTLLGAEIEGARYISALWR